MLVSKSTQIWIRHAQVEEQTISFGDDREIHIAGDVSFHLNLKFLFNECVYTD